MARKITLTVPDSLYQKIDHWRSGFNLSRIFQDAVTDAINKREAFQKRIDEETPLNEIISRLRKEKLNLEQKMSAQAEKAGALWASKAPYEDLLLAVNASSGQAGAIPYIQTYISQTVHQLSEIPEALSEGFENLKATIQEGWLKGVGNFWESVKDRI